MSRLLLILAAALALHAAAGAVSAADQLPENMPAAANPADTDDLEEVTVTAQRHKLDWAQRNELVQKAATFVYGIAPTAHYGDLPPRWVAPVCPSVTGLPRDQGEFFLGRLSDIVRYSGAQLGNEECHPNLFIFVTDHPGELLRTMRSRRYSATFGNATALHVDQFVNSAGPVRVWQNTDPGVVVGPVTVVVDRARLRGVSALQLADYVGMVSLTEIRTPGHLGEAQSILSLFDGSPRSAPGSLSDWDLEFLKLLYHYNTSQSSGIGASLATPRSNIARLMVRDLVP